MCIYVCFMFMFSFLSIFPTCMWNLACRLYLEYRQEREHLRYPSGLKNDTQSFSLDFVAAGRNTD